MSAVRVRPVPRMRRGTLVFLRNSRADVQVPIDIEIDMTRVLRSREVRQDRPSVVAYVTRAVADVLESYPEAQSVHRGGLRPTLAVARPARAKILLDKAIDGQRCVLAGTVPAEPGTPIEEIATELRELQSDDLGAGGRFGPQQRLSRLPLFAYDLVYRALTANTAIRTSLQGSFSISAVGGFGVRCIYPIISGGIGFGMGSVADKPIIRDGDIAVAPVCTLALIFDHRVLDGAIAAEILAGVKNRLENWEN